MRMCVDFRELNKISVKDRFSLPIIDDQLDQLVGKIYYTKLDLKDAFHQVKVDEESVKYFSFVTPQGQYEYCKMPFGFCNSPSIFARYVRKLFKKLLDEGKLLIYIDDILIATYTIEENLAVLIEVFKILVDNLLEIRIAKCSFLYTEITYLGYLVNKDGIRPGPHNVDAISNFPMPKNSKELHSFLGLVSYFRKFIPQYAIMAKPLYDLIKKNSEFKLDDKKIELIDSLKNVIVQKPILSIYNPTVCTELHCDASSLGFGAILLQKQNDNFKHPVSYFSKCTSDYESRYHSFELETLAVVYALKRFHIYVYGIPVKIVTDCDSFRMTLAKPPYCQVGIILTEL